MYNSVIKFILRVMKASINVCFMKEYIVIKIILIFKIHTKILNKTLDENNSRIIHSHIYQKKISWQGALSSFLNCRLYTFILLDHVNLSIPKMTFIFCITKNKQTIATAIYMQCFVYNFIIIDESKLFFQSLYLTI